MGTTEIGSSAGQRRQRRAGWVALGTGLLSAGSALGVAFVPESATGQKIALALIAAVSAVIALAFGFYKNHADVRDSIASTAKAVDFAQQLEAERRRTLIVLTGRLQAAALLVAGLAAASPVERAKKLSGVQTAIVELACALVLAPRPRATYFRIEGMKPRVMRPMHTAGRERTDEPRPEFIEGRGRGQTVWSVIDDGAEPFVRNLSTEPDPELDGVVYQTYITVGVLAGATAYGMLTLNSSGAGELDETDRAMLRILARLLAAAEAMCANP